MLTKISLRKLTDNPEVNGKMPSHAIIASDSEYKNKTTVGKLWLKEGEMGKYLSGELNKENRKYQKKDGTEGEEKAYILITLDEYNKLNEVKLPDVKVDIPDGSVDVDSIPF